MANAGRVAIVPKGDYSSSTAYKRLDLVRYNDKAYVAKKANTGIAPTNTEYWMLMTSDGIVIDSALSDSSTNAVQNKVLKSALDSIQTTSRATLSQAGWYRVAELKGNTVYYSGLFSIVSRYGEGGAISATFLVERSSSNVVISPVGIVSSGTNPFTKVRLTTDGTNAYFEAYYSLSVNNVCMFSVLGSLSAESKVLQYTPWTKLDFVATSETVDGVTVTTTYDIPANASPVNSLDLTSGTYPIGAVGKDKFIAYPKDGYLHSTTGIGVLKIKTPKLNTSGNSTSITFELIVGNHGISANYLSPCKYFISFWASSDGSVNWVSAYSIGVNHSGVENLPVSVGVDENGYFTVLVGNNTTQWRYTTMQIANIVLGERGTDYVNWYEGWDLSIVADISSVTVYYTVTKPFIGADYLKNTGGEISGNTVIFTDEEEWIRLGLEHPLRSIDHGITATGTYKLHDNTNGKDIINSTPGGINTFNGVAAGNLALDAIIKSATAPSNTTLIWIDTANKKLKAYIDGAWTVIA